jgi:hypothetical protein
LFFRNYSGWFRCNALVLIISTASLPGLAL